MRCDCIQKNKDKIGEFLIEKAGIEKEKVQGIYISGELINLTGGKFLSNELRVEYEHIAKSGRKSIKNEKVDISHSYCPFCGVNLKEDK